METNILDLFSKRHSFYQLDNNIPVSYEKLCDIIKRVLELYPSAFNVQESRLVLLLENKHHKFWEIVKEKLLSITPQERHDNITQKIESFDKSFGTILYYIDNSIVEKQQETYPLYADMFKPWALQSNGMLQFMIWTALADYNIGASVQHYNPIIDEEVRKSFDIPANWELIAEMPLGGIVNTPSPHKIKDSQQLIIKKGA